MLVDDSDIFLRGAVVVIKRFFGFLLAEGHTEEDPSLRIPRPKVGKRLPKALSIAKVQTLFAAFKDRTATERRDKAFFQLEVPPKSF